MADASNLLYSNADTQYAVDITMLEAEHIQWLSSDRKAGKRANLRAMDLSQANLSGRNFAEASLRGAVLTGADLSGADLRGADLSEAFLDGANLSGAQLSGASFIRAQLNHANLSGGDMTVADFTGALCEGTNFQHTKMQNAVLREAHLQGANLSHANLREANLRGAFLNNADLTATDLSIADCRDVHFDQATFTGAILQQTSMRAANLNGVNFQSADFSTVIELDAQYQAAFQQARRAHMQEEQDRLRAEMEAHSVSLAQERQRMLDVYHDIQAAQEQFAKAVKTYIPKCIILFILWALLAAVVLGFAVNAALHVQALQWGRFGALMAAVILVLALAGGSLMIVVNMLTLIKMRQQQNAEQMEELQNQADSWNESINAHVHLAPKSTPTL